MLDAPDRATVPLAPRRGRPAPAGRLARGDDDDGRAVPARSRREHGAESVAFLSTGQIATEEMALLGALAKFGMGMVHGDGNTRQCMATAVVAYKQAFGFDAPPYTYQDLEESDCIVLIGANPCIAHPILWERVMRNPHDPEIIVVDPRRTETAMAATLHLPVRPKTDLTLLYGLAHLLIERGLRSTAPSSTPTRTGFDDFAAFVRRFDRRLVASETGLGAEADRRRRRDGSRRGERVSFWWTMGVNQSHQGVKTAQAIINLALMTGNIGRPGTGANSITGQCNAMGSRLFSNTTNLLGGHDFTNPAHRAQGRRAARTSPRTASPTRASWAYDRDHRGHPRGQDPRPLGRRHQPGPLVDRPGRAPRDCSAQARLPGRAGHVPLDRDGRARRPAAAGGRLGREGRDVHQLRAADRPDQEGRRAPGQALADFHIFKLVAALLRLRRRCSPSGRLPRRSSRSSSGSRPASPATSRHRRLPRCSTSRGASSGRYPAEDRRPADRERRLFADGRFYHPDGRARFLFEEPRPMPEPPDARVPASSS